MLNLTPITTIIHQPSTINQTINHHPSTITNNHQSTIIHQPSTINPSTINQQPSSIN
jgi:hypothetical protein